MKVRSAHEVSEMSEVFCSVHSVMRSEIHLQMLLSLCLH